MLMRLNSQCGPVYIDPKSISVMTTFEYDGDSYGIQLRTTSGTSPVYFATVKERDDAVAKLVSAAEVR